MKRLFCLLTLFAVSAGSSLSCERTAVPPSIQEVKAKHAVRLLALPGVVSVGIGRDPGDGAVIVVGLDRARPETAEKIPQELDGHPVRVEVIGPVRAQ